MVLFQSVVVNLESFKERKFRIFGDDVLLGEVIGVGVEEKGAVGELGGEEPLAWVRWGRD